MHTFAVMNNAAVNLGVPRSLWDDDSLLLDIYPEVGLLDRVAVLE